jgi:nucleoside transporter
MSNGSEVRSAGVRLSMMMFMQYAVWGVWLPYLANYLQGPVDQGGLGFTGGQVGWILGLAGSIGAVAAPFLAGQVADRFVRAELYLGILLILGGLLKFVTYYAHTYTSFLWMSIAYSIVYMPTLALTNSIAFAHLDDPEKKFPLVRVWGTIGWIVASNAFPLIWLQTNLHLTALPPFVEGVAKANTVGLFGDCLRVAGVMAVLYGLWAIFALPKTPPTRSVESPLAFTKAFALMKHPGVLICTLAALPISMIHQVYFIRTGPFLSFIGYQDAYIGPVMSIGQFAEITVLALLGWILSKAGYKWTLFLGCVAYFLRFAVFAIVTEETRALAAVAMALHGLCYACFFAASFIYVERVATPDIRHTVQTAYGIIILGAGPIMAGIYNEWLDRFGAPSAQGGNWSSLWWTQAMIGAAMAVLIAVAFRPGITTAQVREAGAGG